MSETEPNITSSIELGETLNTEHKQEIVNKMAEVATSSNQASVAETAENSIENTAEQPKEMVEFNNRPKSISEHFAREKEYKQAMTTNGVEQKDGDNIFRMYQVSRGESYNPTLYEEQKADFEQKVSIVKSKSGGMYPPNWMDQIDTLSADKLHKIS